MKTYIPCNPTEENDMLKKYFLYGFLSLMLYGVKSKVSRKHYLSMLLLLLVSINMHSQLKGYYMIDSTSFSGIKLLDKGNKNFSYCYVEQNGDEIKFSPEEINEYGFYDGNSFKSQEININGFKQKVFIECLTKGRINLYKYNFNGFKRYFIEKDSTLFVELNNIKDSEYYFKNQILKSTHDFPALKQEINFVTYSDNSLKAFIRKYNNLDQTPLPHLKWGLNFGIENTILKSTSEAENIKSFKYDYNSTLSVGLFLDKPILYSNFSIHPELNLSKQGFTYSSIVNGTEYSILINIERLKLPVLIRYTLPVKKLRPYLNAGPSISYSYTNQNLSFEINNHDNIYNIRKDVDHTFIDRYQFGYSLGFGFESIFKYRRSVCFEFRLSHLYGVSDTNIYNILENKFVLSYSFK
ncbi:porin family protein [Saccharicrinis sp. FJH62]|uniref:porin family protein n=1 Tax=Saccharicrinis sp. FJH62 TaxID=3344657 RepID=UPI0035D44EA3